MCPVRCSLQVAPSPDSDPCPLIPRAGSHAIRAKKTEALLVGKEVTNATLQEAIASLKEEIVPVGERAEYRHRLVTGFFFKYFVALLG